MDIITSDAISHIEKKPYALLITIGEENKAFVREIGPFVNNGLTIYFITRLDSQKVKDINNNSSVTLYFQNTNEVLNEFKSASISGNAVRVSEGAEFNDVLNRMNQKSPNYYTYICKEGFDIWTIFKVTAETLQFTDYSKSTRTTKINL